ncbi:unnamed protein product, partial [Effrenium voratum]
TSEAWWSRTQLRFKQIRRHEMRSPWFFFLAPLSLAAAELRWLWGTQVLAKEVPQAFELNRALASYLRNLSASEEPEIRSNRNGAWQSRNKRFLEAKVTGHLGFGMHGCVGRVFWRKATMKPRDPEAKPT